jgi:activator of 2-hydroxyglutaryl-CoA dehydratase
MLLGDFGTSYCKLWEPDSAAPPMVVASKELDPKIRVTLATGHNGKRFGERYVNELIALARGGERLIEGKKDYVLLDCGSRDIKFIRYEDGNLADMGWNAECGASMGFTIELLARYYDLDYRTMPVPLRTFSVTCGVLGMSHIFDAVVEGMPVTEAVAQFVRGIALNAYRFAGSPPVLYLSGGLCDNPLFVGSFPCEVMPLGRLVLLAGLAAMIEDRFDSPGVFPPVTK